MGKQKQSMTENWRETRLKMHRKSTKKKPATHNNIYLYNTNCDTIKYITYFGTVKVQGEIGEGAGVQ